MPSFVPNPHVYPPDGYYFVDQTGVRHRGESWPDLVKRVRDYRVRNGKTVGDVIAEINRFTCERFPAGCQEMGVVFPTTTGGPSPGVKLAASVNRWYALLIQAMSDHPLQLVEKEVADSRAALCLSCPRQKAWTVHCGSCAGATFRIGLSVRRGKEAARGDSLMACEVLGEDTRTSVWLPRLLPSADSQLPDFCWRKGTP